MASSPKPRPRALPASPFISPARPLGAFVAATLGEAMARRGFADANILAKWRDIAGDELASFSRPEKLVWPRRAADVDAVNEAESAGATLHLRVDGPAAIEVQHMAPQILERVNSFLGFAAVTRLRIVQAPVAAAVDATPSRGTPARAEAGSSDTQDDELQGIDDPELRRALANLARAIKRSRRRS